MRTRITVLLAPVTIVGLLMASPAAAQPPAAKPKWVAAHDLKVRKGKETDWDKAPKTGVEVFEDPAAAAIVVIDAAGHLAVAPDTATPSKKAEWNSALSVSVRAASEDKFTTTTALFGVEAFRGAFAGHVLYVSERGGLALFPADTTTSDKDPQFMYGLTLRVRKPGEQVFGPEAKAFGLEAYKDNNTGGLVYVTEGGMLAVSAAAPDKVPETAEVKKPKPLYGLECRVRKADETDFTENTLKFGVEVFRDENTGALIYISEAGSIAVVPPPADLKADQKLSWMHAMTLKARRGGESDFAKARKIGIEVFQDKHTGYTLFITETGSLAVLPKK